MRGYKEKVGFILYERRIVGVCVMVMLQLCCGSAPMSLQRTASGLRISVTNLAASRRISMTLLSRANTGARGKDATNRETNPYWITVDTHTHKQMNKHTL